MGGVYAFIPLYSLFFHTGLYFHKFLCKFMLVLISLHMSILHPADKDQGKHPLLYNLYPNKLGVNLMPREQL